MRARITPFRIVVVLVLALMLTVVILEKIESGYYLYAPDVAHPVAPLVSVEGAKAQRGTGPLYFVDVHEIPASEFDLLFKSWLHPHSTKVKANNVLPPGTTNAQYIQSTLRQMATSQQIASAVAEKELGLPVVTKDNGVLADNVYGDVPAASKIYPADVIVNANGKPTLTLAALREAMSGVKPGDVVYLTLRRGTDTIRVNVKTVADPNDKTRAIIGIVPEQSTKIIKLPVKVKINSQGIGGPSAGLALTLEIMRKLGRDVTHGYRVAATGEIRTDGTVFPIGGVEQKVYGVRQAGAQVFLVPAAGGNASEAKRYAGPDLKIIPVTSLKQALRALAALPKLPQK